MKSLPLVLPFVVCNFLSYGQIDFEKGYYIDNAGERVECLIRNVDWDYNPTSFTVKKGDGQPSEQLTIENAREFGINGTLRYVRATVDVDRSSDKMERLSSSRVPEFKTERIYLKAIVEGKATLYLFSDGILRFYYQMDTAAIQPLVYKRYRSGDAVLENQTFREQLYRLFSCGTPGRADVDRASYSQRDLTRLFLQYNECLGSGITDYTLKKQERDFFNLWIRPRVTLSSLSASRTNDTFDFENQVGFTAGIEAEFILPFNRNKWAIIIEPAFQSYDASIPSEPIKVDYQALELPLGLRHYFFLNENSKISLAFAFQVTFPFQSEVIHYSSVELEIKNTANMAFEAGYVFKKRFCIAYRFQTDKELLGGYAIWSSDYSTMAFVVGYSLF